MCRFTILLLAASLASLLSSPASAQPTVGPDGFQCLVRHPVTARRIAVPQLQEDGDFEITARWSQTRPPMMVYGKQFPALPPLFQRLMQHHECGHIEMRTSNEFLANCYALRGLAEDGLLTPANTTILRDEMCSLGELSQKQGGSGVAYWEETRKLCSDLDLPPCPSP